MSAAVFFEGILTGAGGNVGLLVSAGFLVGIVHAFEPDHVAAMLSRVQGRRAADQGPAALRTATLRSSLLGAVWGFGHTSTILLFSLLVFVLALNIPSAVFDGFELAVGVMLVVLGASMYYRRRAGGAAAHSHPHTHPDGTAHTHAHRHGDGHAHTHKSYIIGCIHGLAGSGGLIAVAATTLSDVSGVLSFVLVFGIGSMVGMSVASGALSVPFLLSAGFVRIRRVLQAAAAAITVIIGLAVIYGIVTSGGMPVLP